MGTERIVFFYCAREAADYARRYGAAPAGSEETQFIAMTPGAYIRLREEGFKARNTLEFFTNDSHMRVMEKCKIVIDWLRENAAFVDLGLGVRRTFKDSFIQAVRMTVYYALWTIEIALNAQDKYKARTLSAPLAGSQKAMSIYIEPQEMYLGAIIRDAAGAKGLGFADISGKRRSPLPAFLQIAGRISYITRFSLRCLKFLLWKRSVIADCVRLGKRPVFVTTKLNMSGVIKDIGDKLKDKTSYILAGPLIPLFRAPDRALRIFWKRESGNIIKQRGLFEELNNRIEGARDVFSYRGVDFARIITRKIKDNIADYSAGSLLWVTELSRLFDALKPSAIVSTGNRLDDTMIAELSRGKNIPDILISHGSHTRVKNEYEAIEWGEHGMQFFRAPFSHLALQSPLAKDYLEAFPASASLLKTGPLVWGRSVKPEKGEEFFRLLFGEGRDFSKTRVVLHSGTQKSSIAFRPYIYESPDEYIDAIQRLSEAVRKIPDTVLVVKFRPRPEISVEDLRALVPFSKDAALSVEEPFNDVLGMSDLLVSFASTTIEEALQNRIPVLLYGGGGRYKHIDAYDIRRGEGLEPKAIYHVRDSRDLEYAVRGVLSLDIAERHGGVFDPYIYSPEVREPLAGVLQGGADR